MATSNNNNYLRSKEGLNWDLDIKEGSLIETKTQI